MATLSGIFIVGGIVLILAGAVEFMFKQVAEKPVFIWHDPGYSQLLK
jgi:hypothetical protein